MSLKIFFTIFITVFLAELGDKTQLSTLLFATNKENSKVLVFLASALALCLSSFCAVLLGGFLEKFLNPKILSWLAGLGFIFIGLWMLLKS